MPEVVQDMNGLDDAADGRQREGWGLPQGGVHASA